MVEGNSDSQHEQTHLSTAEAAERMGVSRKTVRDLCKQGLLPGTFQQHENGPWRIPADAVSYWLEHRSPDTPGPPAWWQRFRYTPWVFYPTVVLTILVTVAGLVAGLISAGADFGGATQQLQEWGLLRTFPPESEGEILIVIATFRHSEGVLDTEIHNEICRAIQEAAAELNLSHLRVEVEPTTLTADDRAGAEKLGKRYNASMVIWGADTGVRVTVNFLNFKQPGFDAAEVQINETERTQLANPESYTSLLTEDLPGQLTFLSLFAIGQSYYIEGAYTDSIRVIERAVGSLAQNTKSPVGLAEAYFRLGWLYQKVMGDSGQAIVNYSRAIILDPNLVAAYSNLGVAHYAQGDLVSAITNYTSIVELLRPDYAPAYNNRGVARYAQGDLGGAITDYNRAIELNPDYAEAYYNRGNAHKAQGDLQSAIADYDQSIELDPDYAKAYNNRGNTYRALGDSERATADYGQAIELSPDFAEVYNNRGLARYDQGDLLGAIADYDRAISLNLGYVEVYFNRGNARKAQDDLEGAIADYNQAITLDPDYAAVYNNRGNAYKAQGKLDAAIADYGEAVTIDPDLAEAYYNRGATYRQLGNIEAALADFRYYLELQPDAENRAAIEEWIAELEAQLSGP